VTMSSIPISKNLAMGLLCAFCWSSTRQVTCEAYGPLSLFSVAVRSSFRSFF
jgi:hypothetical protein